MPLIRIENIILDSDQILFVLPGKEHFGGKIVDSVKVYLTPNIERSAITLWNITIDDLYEKINKEVALVHKMERATHDDQKA